MAATDDIIDGTSGYDVINSGSGADTVDGGDDDQINAGGGDDTVDGGAGVNDLYGGGGADIFVIAPDNLPASHLDVINDITPGEDRIDLSAFAGLDFASLDTNSDGRIDTADGSAGSIPTFTIFLGSGFDILSIAGVNHLDSGDLLFS